MQIMSYVDLVLGFLCMYTKFMLDNIRFILKEYEPYFMLSFVTLWFYLSLVTLDGYVLH